MKTVVVRHLPDGKLLIRARGNLSAALPTSKMCVKNSDGGIIIDTKLKQPEPAVDTEKILAEMRRMSRALTQLHPELPKIEAELRASELQLQTAKNELSGAISDARRGSALPEDFVEQAKQCRIAIQRALTKSAELINYLNTNNHGVTK